MCGRTSLIADQGDQSVIFVLVLGMRLVIVMSIRLNGVLVVKHGTAKTTYRLIVSGYRPRGSCNCVCNYPTLQTMAG